jgi:DNA-binding response OmpR family regulator
MNNYKVYKQNKEIELTAIGYEILFLLVKYQGTVITRERMIEFIEERTGNYIENNTVSVHMKRIREKLGTYNNQSYIETVRGIGYRWKI